MSSTSGKKSKHLIRKIISLFFLITICLFILFILFLRFFLPQDQVKLYSEKSLSQALEKSVNIQKLKVNPFGSINIQNIVIYDQSAQEAQTDTLVQIKKIVLKYKFFSLFRRRLWITEALIHSPEFHILSGTENSEPEDSTIQTNKQQKQTSVTEEKSAASLPFTFLMSGFAIKDCTISLVINNDSDKTIISLEGLHVDISRVNLPRDFQQSREWIRGSVKLYTEEGNLRIRSKDYNDQFRTDIVITAAYRTLTRWNIIGNIKVGRKEWGKNVWPGLSVDIEGRNFSEILSIKKASLHTNNIHLINITGSIINLKKFDLTLNSTSVDLENVLNSYAGVFSDMGLHVPASLQISGFLDPVHGSIYGSSDSLQVSVDSRLNLERFLMTGDSTLLNKGFINLHAVGVTDLTKIKGINLEGDFGFESFKKSIDDSVLINTGEFSGNVTTHLDSLFFPVNGTIYCTLNDLLQGKVKLEVGWTSDATILTGTEGVILNAGLQADSLELSVLPFHLPNIKGRTGVDFHLFSRGGTRNRMKVNCMFDSVQYNHELIGNVKHILHATAFIQADSDFSEIVLDTCEFSIDKVLECSIQGNYSKIRGFSFDLNQAVIDNAEIAAYLPRPLSENLRLSGYEHISACFQGSADPDTFSTSLTAGIKFINTGFGLLEQKIFADSLQGSVDLQGDRNNFAGEGEIVINTLQIPEMRSSSLKNSSLNFKGKVNDLNRFSLSTVDILLPSLGLSGCLQGSLNHLPDDSSASIKGDAFIELDCPDTVTMLSDVLVKGRMCTRIQAETYDSAHKKIRITGNLHSDTLEINSEDKFRIMNIKSSLPFRIDYDLNEHLLVNSSADSIYIKKDYLTKRSLYQRLFPEIGRVTLDSLEISTYQIDKIDTDILCTGNSIQLPWINVDLFGGNIAGDLFLNLNTGKLNNITYTLTGNANRINSAMISTLKQKKKKRSELDATFRFRGKGFDVREVIDVSGYFHIINLGSDFASNLLSSIDPSGSDRSIKMTKQLINTGWKPGIFSFELRHGYVYPSFNLHQPWFSPVRLPERLEYGRLPLSFFLKRK